MFFKNILTIYVARAITIFINDVHNQHIAVCSHTNFKGFKSHVIVRRGYGQNPPGQTPPAHFCMRGHNPPMKFTTRT